MVNKYAAGDLLYAVYPGGDWTKGDQLYRWIIDGPLKVSVVKENPTFKDKGPLYTFEEWEDRWVPEIQVFAFLSEAVAYMAKQLREIGYDAHPDLREVRGQQRKALQWM